MHTAELLDPYLHHIFLFHLTKIAYQLSTMVVYETDCNCINRGAAYPYWIPQVTLCV